MCFYLRAVLFMLNLHCTFQNALSQFYMTYPLLKETFAFCHIFVWFPDLQLRTVLTDHKSYILNWFVILPFKLIVHICVFDILHPGSFASYILHLNDYFQTYYIWQVVCDCYEATFFSPHFLLYFLFVYEYVCDMGISSEITILPAQAVLWTFYLK